MSRMFGTTALAAIVPMVAATLLIPAPTASAQRLSLAERVARLEQQANAQDNGSSINLVNQVQALQSQVQALQGQIEELRHQVDESRQRAKDQYIDLDSRIGRLEGRAAGTAAASAPVAAADRHLTDIDLGAVPAAPVAGAGAPTPPGTSENPADATEPANPASPENPDLDAGAAPNDETVEKAAYDDAFAALKDGRYAESARRFQSFMDDYPSSSLSGNADYWLGESYYVTQNYRIALQTFENLLQRYPDNQKAPDALLKVGYCQYELKQWDDARATLTEVTRKYPGTTVARLAEGRLRALKTDDREQATDAGDR
ncbi:MAG: tol-pal system protein YbgF [Rhodanobacteraceae bacterium]